MSSLTLLTTNHKFFSQFFLQQHYHNTSVFLTSLFTMTMLKCAKWLQHAHVIVYSKQALYEINK